MVDFDLGLTVSTPAPAGDTPFNYSSLARVMHDRLYGKAKLKGVRCVLFCFAFFFCCFLNTKTSFFYKFLSVYDQVGAEADVNSWLACQQHEFKESA